MSEYDELFKELQAEFGRIGEIRILSSKDVLESGRILNKFTDRMVDKAAMKLGRKQRQIEIGETVEKLFRLLSEK